MAKSRKAGRKSALRLGIDLGGTKILAAVVDAQGKVLGEAKKSTHPERGQDAVIDRIVKTAKEAMAAAGVDSSTVAVAGIGAPGPVDTASGVVYRPPNLEGWDEVPLGNLLSKGLDMPVFVDNDVNLGTLAEQVLGAGQGAQDLVAIFVGTGVGGGIIIDGKLQRGFRGAAGEIGHIIVDPDGPLCGCGRRGCLEAFASRTAIERDVRAAMAGGRPSIVGELLAAADRNRLTSGVIAEALSRQDALMVEVITQVQRYLGIAVANVVNLLDPQVVVFGGGVVEALGEQFIAPIRKVARPLFLQQMKADQVRIVAATLGDHAGVLGASIMAAQQAELEP